MLPNRQQSISPDFQFSFAQQDTWKIKMENNFLAQAQFCKGGSNCEAAQVNGKWTPIYSQHLVVELQNGLRFYTNFRYNRKEGETDPNTGTYDSDCSKTMVGFVQKMNGSEGSMLKYPTQCMFGERVEHQQLEQAKGGNLDNDNESYKYKSFQRNSDGVEAVAEEAPKAEAAPKKAAAKKNPVPKRKNLNLAHVPSDENDLLISTINSSDFGWKADTCKLQSHHPDYKCDDGETLLLQTDSDIKAVSDEMSEEQEAKQYKQKLEEVQKWQNTY